MHYVNSYEYNRKGKDVGYNIFCADTSLDVFKCLERNEVEKCQLVSNFWNKFIRRNANSLKQRRRIYQLKADTDDYCRKVNFYKTPT